MAQSQTDLATGFESQICSRCGGCGRYSFNQMDRDMCYGCRGCGLVFTKRGSVARQYFQDSILTAAGDVKAEWIARGNNGKWFPVVSVEPYQMRGASLTNGVMVPYNRPGGQYHVSQGWAYSRPHYNDPRPAEHRGRCGLEKCRPRLPADAHPGRNGAQEGCLNLIYTANRRVIRSEDIVDQAIVKTRQQWAESH